MGYNKYCDPARVDIVENLRIRFTPANEFNDPFECLPDARLIEHPAWQRMIENASVREFLAEEAIKAQRERRPVMNIEAEIRRIHRERYSIRLPVMKRMAREHLRAARDPLRVLCLSQVAPDAEDALLLWGHYTSNHRGFALTFNENDAWFVGHKPVEGQPWDSGAVIYAERRPSWNVDEQGGVEPRPDFVFTKSLHWAYE
jgi:hypothetical protein